MCGKIRHSYYLDYIFFLIFSKVIPITEHIHLMSTATWPSNLYMTKLSLTLKLYKCVSQNQGQSTIPSSGVYKNLAVDAGHKNIFSNYCGVLKIKTIIIWIINFAFFHVRSAVTRRNKNIRSLCVNLFNIYKVQMLGLAKTIKTWLSAL